MEVHVWLTYIHVGNHIQNKVHVHIYLGSNKCTLKSSLCLSKCANYAEVLIYLKCPSSVQCNCIINPSIGEGL